MLFFTPKESTRIEKRFCYLLSFALICICADCCKNSINFHRYLLNPNFFFFLPSCSCLFTGNSLKLFWHTAATLNFKSSQCQAILYGFESIEKLISVDLFSISFICVYFFCHKTNTNNISTTKSRIHQLTAHDKQYLLYKKGIMPEFKRLPNLDPNESIKYAKKKNQTRKMLKCLCPMSL